jgi:enamine deaminase RidA (YjgF/YER057c/UK114 family)
MKIAAVLLLSSFLTCASFAFQTDTAASKSSGAAAQATPNATPAKQTDFAKAGNTGYSVYHAGPWEQQIGYAQAIRAGHTIYISGAVGADDKGFPKDMEAQMKLAYSSIEKTMDHYGASFSNVVMERIYTTDIDGLIKCQETRKRIYGNWLPASSWVEVRRLYAPEAIIEIEVELVVE